MKKLVGFIAGAVQLALQAAVLIDLTARDAKEVRGPKWAWALASFVNYLGPLAYIFFSGRRR